MLVVCSNWQNKHNLKCLYKYHMTITKAGACMVSRCASNDNDSIWMWNVYTLKHPQAATFRFFPFFFSNCIGTNKLNLAMIICGRIITLNWSEWKLHVVCEYKHSKNTIFFVYVCVVKPPDKSDQQCKWVREISFCSMSLECINVYIFCHHFPPQVHWIILTRGLSALQVWMFLQLLPQMVSWVIKLCTCFEQQTKHSI